MPVKRSFFSLHRATRCWQDQLGYWSNWSCGMERANKALPCYTHYYRGSAVNVARIPTTTEGNWFTSTQLHNNNNNNTFLPSSADNVWFPSLEQFDYLWNVLTLKTLNIHRASVYFTETQATSIRRNSRGAIKWRVKQEELYIYFCYDWSSTEIQWHQWTRLLIKKFNNLLELRSHNFTHSTDLSTEHDDVFSDVERIKAFIDRSLRDPH